MNTEDLEQLKNEYSQLSVEEAELESDLYWIKDRLEKIEEVLDEHGML
jgi:hypothetical protein